MVEISGCPRSDELRSKIDGQPAELSWSRTPYSGRWLAQLPELAAGHHTIEVAGACPSGFHWRIHRFDVVTTGASGPALALERHYAHEYPAHKQAWDWGPGVLLYGMVRLAEAQGRASDYVSAYHRHWARAGAPKPDRSDSCPPALSALALARDGGDWTGMAGAAAVADYLKFEPRDGLGALNHLGHSFYAAFFPQSIWVDSLMMYAVLAAQWGDFTHDPALKEFGLAQPALFASVLQDPATGLFRHAWKTDEHSALPSEPAFWLRGNGWVLVSIAELLDQVDPASSRGQELVGIFRRAADGLIRYQLPSGLWDMMANLPGLSYPETSGSALVAYALARGAHRGWLGPSYLAPAKSAFEGVTAMLLSRRDGLAMPWISGATNPGPLWTYGLVGPTIDQSYGVGAYLLAASELLKETF
jgi:unsaturated rhamnogalacturonyl hydrolase